MLKSEDSLHRILHDHMKWSMDCMCYFSMLIVPQNLQSFLSYCRVLFDVQH